MYICELPLGECFLWISADAGWERSKPADPVPLLRPEGGEGCGPHDGRDGPQVHSKSCCVSMCGPVVQSWRRSRVNDGLPVLSPLVVDCGLIWLSFILCKVTGSDLDGSGINCLTFTTRPEQQNPLTKPTVPRPPNRPSTRLSAWPIRCSCSMARRGRRLTDWWRPLTTAQQISNTCRW